MPRSPKKPTAGEENDTKPYAAGSAKNPPTSAKKTLVTKKWSREDKLNILMDVIATANPDWEAISKKHEGRTANMVKDQWRKTLFPALQKTGSIDGSAGGKAAE